MGSNKCRLGTFIELRENTNDDLSYGVSDVRGVNNLKELMSTKSDLNGRDLSKFQLVYPGEFVFNHRTSRNGSKFSIAYNDGSKPIICTEDYVVFRIKPECKKELSARWLYMFFNRPEFDRYVITNSWGSSTEFYNWEDVQAIELELPSYAIQQKYVNVYNAMLANQQSYECGLEDLKLVCDSYIENLRKHTPAKTIGQYLIPCEQRNDIGLSVDSVRGLSVAKQVITTKANMDGVSLNSYKLFPPKAIAYVADTSRRGDKMSLGFNDSEDTYLVSSISTVFRTDENYLLPEYLMLFFCRDEFDRYARFHSWGSARETFDWDEMCSVEIPVPDVTMQQDIVDIFKAYNTRKGIAETLKNQIQNICPILIKGSIEEAQKTDEA
ncbi:restriction endonuclease subunit S [Faecalibacterium prausnitzii]|uniref:restriction endonuclease subunit S n=1 Tax=Faecalibacterium prausnitzii TaxID=853 RepID=UPI00130E0701|nr:restriction endonuclease subunit S [Faecalibacterium prausnitzii]